MKTVRREPRIVVLGGGTGLATLLRGLKKHSSALTAVVTVTDDGGSSGALRRELGVLPPGDIRSCLVALSEEENLMARLFQYRFPHIGSLSGHSFGNLFLTAMSALTGGFDSAIARVSEVLAIRGRVLPATLESVTLAARLSDGTTVHGESNISRSDARIDTLTIHPPLPPAGPQVAEAIAAADAIVLGPGSLYTSIIATLLVDGIAAALRAAAAPRIYVCNVMTQPGETPGFKLSDHLAAIEKHAGKGLLDYAVANTGRISPDLARRYAHKDSFPVTIDRKTYPGVRLVKANLGSNYEYARHDPERLAEVLMGIIAGFRGKRALTRGAARGTQRSARLARPAADA